MSSFINSSQSRSNPASPGGPVIVKTKLTKIGPGLGSRLRIWQKLYVWMSNLPNVNEKEMNVLRQLANGLSWIDFVPDEWKEIYSAMYDESVSLDINEKEIGKIDKDVPRTYSLFTKNARTLRLHFPSDMKSYYTALKNVLVLASHERGYCQGINFIAAELLLELADEKTSFIVLSYLLKNRELEILFDPKYSALFDYMRIFEKKLRKYNLKLYKHFKKCDFRPSSYAIEWFTTCFIVTCPGELALCLLDLLVAGIDDIMIRAGLSLLTVLQHKLLRLDFEGLHENFKNYSLRADPTFVMLQALKIPPQSKCDILHVSLSLYSASVHQLY
jgi:hypothetical protein